jgi:Ni/Co efflux regulator RcnB
MKKLPLAAACAFALCVGAPAFAKDHGHGHGHGHGKHDRDDVVVYDDGPHGHPHGCPPGLAKKHNGCLPPGQAKKLAVGHRLPPDVRYYAVPQPVLVRLPPARPGYRYVMVGNDVVLLQPRTNIVINIFANLG